MKKNNKIYEEHTDLVEFAKYYNNRIDEFLKCNPETRIVFLNADFGWGKTTFIKNNLKISDNCIYSPWLNKSDNYIEELYYNITKKDKGFLSSAAIFISIILTIITILFGSIISILVELNKDNSYTCEIINFKLICSNSDTLITLLCFILGLTIIVIMILGIIIFSKPIPIINFFKKDSGKYYENKIIKNIIKKVDLAIVIEDIDRTDDIEEILVAANKISEYMKDNHINKYILITGDYIRMVRRISEPSIYDNNNFDLATYRDKGVFLTEKVISLRVDFSNIHKRIDTLFSEYNISANLVKIEYDEIISFIKNRYLSIRFFIRFLDKYKTEIAAGNSIYHLLLKYYQEEKYFNIEDNVVNNSIYNISKFPNCLNDIEMLLQKGKLKINDHDYKLANLKVMDSSNYNKITGTILSVFIKNEKDYQEYFKLFYNSNKYPRLSTDKLGTSNYNSNKTNIGETLPNNLKQDLDNYLIGHNNNETGMMENILINKRCYFDSINSSHNYDNYRIKLVNNEDTIEVEERFFICSYIACFLRENNREIIKNYPKIYELIIKIVN